MCRKGEDIIINDGTQSHSSLITTLAPENFQAFWEASLFLPEGIYIKSEQPDQKT